MSIFDKALAKKKPFFLAQLKEQWKALLPQGIDIDIETEAAWNRIQESGSAQVFKSFGISKEDIRKVITEIVDERT